MRHVRNIVQFCNCGLLIRRSRHKFQNKPNQKEQFRMSTEKDRDRLKRGGSMSQSAEQLTVELSCKLTSEQVELWRLAINRASDEEESKKAAKQLFRSLRASGTRYTVRQLRVEPKLTSQQADKRHSGFNGVI
jgi:hypothetical protein